MDRLTHCVTGVGFMLCGAFLLFVILDLCDAFKANIGGTEYWLLTIRIATYFWLDAIRAVSFVLAGIGLIVYSILEAKNAPLWPPIVVAILVLVFVWILSICAQAVVY